MSFIEISDLHYRYEEGIQALNGLYLSIEQGEIFGFLGSNGAGKSTTFKILVGLLQPSQGEVLINGKRVHYGDRELYSRVGYMPDAVDIYGDFRVEGTASV